MKPLDRGKVLTAEDLTRLGGFARYRDVDGDAIPYRTLPGTDHPKAAYFTRGSGHDDKALYTEKPDDYNDLMDPAGAQVRYGANAGSGAGGGTGREVEGWNSSPSARPTLRWRRAAIDLMQAARPGDGLLRIRAYPFLPRFRTLWPAHERVYVVEQNRDAQMQSLLKLDHRGSGNDKAAQRAALQRTSDGRGERYRSSGCAGGTAKNGNHYCYKCSGTEDEPYWAAGTGLSRRQDDALRGLRT